MEKVVSDVFESLKDGGKFVFSTFTAGVSAALKNIFGYVGAKLQYSAAKKDRRETTGDKRGDNKASVLCGMTPEYTQYRDYFSDAN